MTAALESVYGLFCPSPYPTTNLYQLKPPIFLKNGISPHNQPFPSPQAPKSHIATIVAMCVLKHVFKHVSKMIWNISKHTNFMEKKVRVYILSSRISIHHLYKALTKLMHGWVFFARISLTVVFVIVKFLGIISNWISELLKCWSWLSLLKASWSPWSSSRVLLSKLLVSKKALVWGRGFLKLIFICWNWQCQNYTQLLRFLFLWNTFRWSSSLFIHKMNVLQFPT